MTQKSLDQQRATHAWRATDGRIDHKLASGAPALIMSNGLMSTLAFYRHKGHGHEELLDAITSWIGPRILDTSREFKDVMTKLHESDSDRYIRATEEALEILKWIRQFAKARAKD